MRLLLISLILISSIKIFAQDIVTINATYSYSEFGDLPHIVFTDNLGEEWDFGLSENNFGDFDFGQDNEYQTNESLVGKMFVITAKREMTKIYAEDGETEIDVELLSVESIKIFVQDIVTINATYSYSEFGDLPHIVFTDNLGEEWDFGLSENNFGDFDFGQDNEYQTNESLVGKMFVITAKREMTKIYAEDGETEIDVELFSVESIKLKQ